MLRCTGKYLGNFKYYKVYLLLQRILEHKDGDNSLMRKVFSLYLNFLQTSQSESLQKHVFASWRSFIKKVCYSFYFLMNLFLSVKKCCVVKLSVHISESL